MLEQRWRVVKLKRSLAREKKRMEMMQGSRNGFMGEIRKLMLQQVKLTGEERDRAIAAIRIRLGVKYLGNGIGVTTGSPSRRPTETNT